MMDQYQQAFQEEARELLAELEAALLELDQNREDREVVGRAFRALHTIKGSGAMFGFDAIASFTHHLENAFDQLRNGRLAVTGDLIRLALAAGDQIKSMLDAAAGATAADPGRSEEILAAVEKLTGPAATGNSVPAPQATVAAEGVPHEWRVHFRPAPDALLQGTNPLLLLAELRSLGDLQTKVDTAEVPLLSELDPERCYLGWDVVLKTTASRETIRDVFIFIEDEAELHIESSAEAAPALRKSAAAAVSPKAAGPATNSIRVSADKLDQLVNLVGELVTVQARLNEASVRLNDTDLSEVAQAVERLTSELRENSMSVRMLPLRTTFERFRRLVHDLGAELGKEVDLEVEGADTELDKTVIDQLNDPLVHLIRNSMDHGLEPPAERLAAGKPARAVLHLSALHSGAHVLIRVQDDGRGLDAEAVRARAVEQHLIDPAARLTEPEIFSLILAPGFSTARQITDVSGRGVGMDVVRRSVEALHGSIELASVPGAGLTVTLRLPLTLAIIDGLLVRVGRAYFILPLANSLECVELTAQDVRLARGNHVANVRGEIIPYVRLSEYFRADTPRGEREQIMVVETEYGRYGFVVDEVLGDHQTVIKNLGKLYRHVQVVSGATILGDGTVALILDPDRLVQSAIQTATLKRRPGHRSAPETHSRDGHPGQRRSRRDGATDSTNSKGNQETCYVK